MPKFDPAQLVEVSVSLPFGIGSAKWQADSTERKAAWELYIELVTRVAVQPLDANAGLVREALNSLYSLFASTREILRTAGPNVGASKQSVGGIAIAVLNNGLRPFLSKWHPILQEWEAQKPQGVSAVAHEKGWELEREVRQELSQLRTGLEAYAHALAAIAGVDD
ncbi:MAG TPA: hypothetical protein VLS96_08990 [Nodosilinea sp.]|nr:hypothetical protein [Nodosilinea sp.]